MSNNILNSQNRNCIINWFTTINDIWNLSETFLNDIARSFHWIWYYKDILTQWIIFWWKNFYNYWDDIFMFEYASLEQLQHDSANWKKRCKKKNSLTSETIDEKQILESSWYFEFNWKFYLLWLLYQDINDDDNDERKWVYKWVIINSDTYFKVEDEAKKIAWEIGDVL